MTQELSIIPSFILLPRSSINMLSFIISMCLTGVLGAEYTLPGICPEVKLQQNFDYEKFSGTWHHIAGYASDGRYIHDCATLDFSKVGTEYALRQTYVELDQGKKTQKWFLARVNHSSDPENYSHLMVYQKVLDSDDNEHDLEEPFMILSTDYDNYAIAYTCSWLKEKVKKHYIFTWILTRSKQRLYGETLKKIEGALSEYPELYEHRLEFVFKEFNNVTCAFENKVETDYHSSYFC